MVKERNKFFAAEEKCAILKHRFDEILGKRRLCHESGKSRQI